MKKVNWLWILCLACILLAVTQGRAEFVPLYFHYDHSDCEAYAEVEIFGDGDSAMADEWGWGEWDAYAMADTSLLIEDPPGSGNWYEATGGTNTDTSVDYWEDSSNGYVELNSYSNAMGGSDSPYGSWHRAEARASIGGSLEVGTSGSFPAGAGGLSLEIIVEELYAGWNPVFSDWELELSSDDPLNPFNIVMNWGISMEEIIPVLAGQIVNVEFWCEGGTDDMDMFDAGSEFLAGFTIIPEPAAILIFSLGGLILRKRRK
ncbi:MAG: PEP-CTERM sorting domain-containing protein [Anaerohalosphaeraceae bacterium]|nr:PEP-CTERM sorting domain-containing protein [Anaerohalosphaeraceae bacterium]